MVTSLTSILYRAPTVRTAPPEVRDIMKLPVFWPEFLQVVPESVEYSTLLVLTPVGSVGSNALTINDLFLTVTVSMLGGARYPTPVVSATIDAEAELFPALFADRRATV